MSQIIQNLTCKHCDAIYTDLYISFGHPEEDIKWKWKCDKCKKNNMEIIEALPELKLFTKEGRII